MAANKNKKMPVKKPGRSNYGELFWATVEDDHVFGGLTFKELSGKYGVNAGSLTYQSKKRNWDAKRKIQRQGISGAITATKNEIIKLTNKLGTLDSSKNEDVGEWDRTMKNIRVLRLNLKAFDGDVDRFGDVLGATRSFNDFLSSRCEDKVFMEKLADWMEQWFQWLVRQ